MKRKEESKLWRVESHVGFSTIAPFSAARQPPSSPSTRTSYKSTLLHPPSFPHLLLSYYHHNSPRFPSAAFHSLSFTTLLFLCVIFILIIIIMKFGRSSFILATLASSSSFKALAAPTESRDQQQHAVARQLPAAPDTGALTGAAGPALGTFGGLPGVPGLPGLPGPPKGGSQPPPSTRTSLIILARYYT